MTTETKHTSNTEDGKLHDAMKEMIANAQFGFIDLQSMEKACAALVRNSKHGESDLDLSCARNLMDQLANKAQELAAVTDVVSVKRIAQSGAA